MLAPRTGEDQGGCEKALAKRIDKNDQVWKPVTPLFVHQTQEDALAHPTRPRVTIQDLADRAADPAFHGRLLPTSPRSVEACLRLGIDPASLRHIPLSAYQRWEGDAALAQLAYSAEEELRLRRLRNLLEERGRLEEEGGAVGPRGRGGAASPAATLVGEAADAAGTSAMIEREAKRLEVLRRRQERELAQLVAHELARKERQTSAQAKIAALEERAEAQRAAQREQAAAWGRAQRERALERQRQEQEKEREAQALEAARRAREEEQAAAEAEEAARRREAAHRKELARQAKAAAAKEEIKRTLARQEAEINARRERMAQREAQREAAKVGELGGRDGNIYVWPCQIDVFGPGACV